MFSVSVTFAQMFQVESASSKKFSREISSVKTPTDTAGFSVNFLPEFAVGAQVVTYTNQGGGYVFGVNSINGTSINKIAQGYIMNNPSTMGIEGVCMFFCGKTSVSNDATSKLTFRIFNKPDSIPTTQVGTAAADLLFSDCDTTFLNFSTASFAAPVAITADFSIVCDFTNIKTDTIGFFSDQDGEGMGYNALRYGTTWYTYVKGYGLNTNISLFAIIDVNYIGIDGDYFFQGSKMTINQNPAKDNLSVSYAVEKNSKVNFEVLSMTGKVVYKQDEGTRDAGNVYSISADISNLAAGTYLASLNCNGQRLIKKIVVE